MKKLLWLMLLLPIFMSRVWASEVYYSDYGSFTEFQEQVVNSTDTINVETKLMYKWYKNVKIPGEYKLYNSQDNFLDNCYETNYSSWVTAKPTITESTILEEKTIYNYQMIKPVRYIHLYNLKGSYDAFRIPELQVFVDDKEIDYTYTCEGCWENFDKYIHNGIYLENNSYIDNEGSLIIDLGKEYPINKVKVLFYIFDMGESDKQYTIGYSNDKTNIFISKSYIHHFSSVYIKDAQKFEYKITDLGISTDLWLTNQTSEQYIDNEYVYSRDSYKQYRYKDKMCQTYTLEKEYYPQYSTVQVQDYTLKDSEKLFYRYQTRDKLELNIHDITEKNYDLNNFVISSTDNYTIENNINWNKNGQYQLKFTINDLIVNKDVNVSILSNSLEEKDEEIKELEEQLQNTKKDYEKIIATLEKTNEEYLNSLNDLNNDIIALNKKISELEDIDNHNIELIEDIRQQLKNHIDNYNKKIQELEKINQSYLENINILSNTIYSLDDQIKSLENGQAENKEEIQNIKNEIENYITKYDDKIKYLEEFNKEYIDKLQKINLEIEIINQNLNTLKLTTEQQYNELNEKINNNSKLIIEIEALVLSNIEQFKSLNVEIDSIKQKLKELEDNSNSQHSEIIDKIENLDEKTTKEFESLNLEIDSLIREIKKLQDKDLVHEEDINSLKVKLEENLKRYENKIIDLENVNKTYSEELTDLQETIYSLYEDLNSIKNKEENNIESIKKLKEDLENNINIYNKKIKDLEKFNKTYSENLKNTDLKVKDLIIEIQEIKIENVNLYEELSNQLKNNEEKINIIENNNTKTIEQFKETNDKIIDLQMLLDKIEINNSDKYNKVITNQEELYDKILDYENSIEYLKQVNENYLIQINSLNSEIVNLNNKLDIIKSQTSNNYNEMLEGQSLIYDQLVKTNNDLKDNYSKELESLKSNLMQASQDLEETTEQNINDKLNNFVLKINGIEKINLLWLYIILSSIFIFYVIYLFKKKSNKNNN